MPNPSLSSDVLEISAQRRHSGVDLERAPKPWRMAFMRALGINRDMKNWLLYLTFAVLKTMTRPSKHDKPPIVIADPLIQLDGIVPPPTSPITQLCLQTLAAINKLDMP